MPSWNPEVYERYKTQRDRPALDLLLQIPADLEPTEIWDLGCGTGEHAALLVARHPGARVHGLDSSPEMLERARARKTSVDWVLGDVANFAPEQAPDLIFSNAALQWVGDHAALFPMLAAMLGDDGVLACQMPISFTASWHRILRETAAEGPWAAKLKDLRGVNPLAEPDQYYDWLRPHCADVDIWTTTYLHVLEGDDPIVDWMMGTGLRPYLDALPEPTEQDAFLDAYRAAVSAVFPVRLDGATLFPFPRMFICARR